MRTEKEVQQTVTVVEEVCDICKTKVVQTEGLATDDPSFLLQGYVHGEKAFHYSCLEKLI